MERSGKFAAAWKNADIYSQQLKSRRYLKPDGGVGVAKGSLPSPLAKTIPAVPMQAFAPPPVSAMDAATINAARLGYLPGAAWQLGLLAPAAAGGIAAPGLGLNTTAALLQGTSGLGAAAFSELFPKLGATGAGAFSTMSAGAANVAGIYQLGMGMDLGAIGFPAASLGVVNAGQNLAGLGPFQPGFSAMQQGLQQPSPVASCAASATASLPAVGGVGCFQVLPAQNGTQS